MYSKLSPEHRRLVAAGNITEGMSKDAVFLAWGSPSQVYQLEEDGKGKERWVYTSTRPTHETHVGIGYGIHPRYRRWGYDGCIYNRYPRTTYVSERVAMVVFHKDLVESWERKQ